jgi:hypothetical protein
MAVSSLLSKTKLDRQAIWQPNVSSGIGSSDSKLKEFS